MTLSHTLRAVISIDCLDANSDPTNEGIDAALEAIDGYCDHCRDQMSWVEVDLETDDPHLAAIHIKTVKRAIVKAFKAEHLPIIRGYTRGRDLGCVHVHSVPNPKYNEPIQ